MGASLDKSGLITLILGKCFCEACPDKILSNKDLSELIGSCRPMTDTTLYTINYESLDMNTINNIHKFTQQGFM